MFIYVPVYGVTVLELDVNQFWGPKICEELLGKLGNNSEKKESIWRDWYWYKTKKDAMFETSRFLRRFCNL